MNAKKMVALGSTALVMAVVGAAAPAQAASAATSTATVAGSVTVASSGAGTVVISRWDNYVSYNIWLDEAATVKLVALVRGGASTSAVSAALTAWTGVALPAHTVASVQALGSGRLANADWNNCGLGINVNWVGTAWAWGR